MPVALQYKKTGGSVARLTQTFLSGEIFFDTDVDGFFVGDSATAGGLEVANSDITAIAAATHNIAVGDAGKLFVYSNSGGCAVALNQAGSSGGTYFPKQSGFWALNNSTGTVIITVTTSLINGVSTLTLNPGDSTVVVSDGTNYFALITRAGISLLTPIDITIIGNTTAVSSSGTVLLSGSTLSATGGVSAGYSAGTLIFSNPNVNATQNDTALGNTTASTSATTQLIGSSVISGAGDLSIGFSSSTLILSAPGAATSTTNRNAVALGNTTGATSSTVLTLTNLSVSGTAGISVGFSTTGAGAGVLVVSQAPIGGSAATMSMVAIGNTTGSTSSETLNITAETYSFGGLLSGGFSNSTFLISGSAPGTGLLSYFEPRPAAFSSLSFGNPGQTEAYFNPLNLPKQLTFNRVKIYMSQNFATLFGPIFAIQTTTTSDTLTASASQGFTFSVANYTQVNSTQWSVGSIGTVTTGFSVSASASRSSNSVSGTQTVSWFVNADTNISTVTASMSSSSTSSLSIGILTNPVSNSFSGVFEFVIPLSTTMATGLNNIGLKISSGATAGGSLSTGASISAIAVVPFAPLFGFINAVGNVVLRTTPGGGAASIPQHPWGAGALSSAGSALPTSFNPYSMSVGAGAYAPVYMELLNLS